VKEIGDYIPLETVRWFGPAFRYTDQGWTFVHIEGEPYDRGTSTEFFWQGRSRPIWKSSPFSRTRKTPGWDGTAFARSPTP